MIRRWLALTYHLYALRLAALSHFQAAFGAQRVGSQCLPYPIWMFCKKQRMAFKPLPTHTEINMHNTVSRRVGTRCPRVLP